MENSRCPTDSKTKLIVDRSELTFAYPKTGQTTIVGVKVKQLGMAAPLMLAVANPSWFGLSHNLIDSSFGARLSIIPPAEGYLVYIRYTPKSILGHRTFLMATTPYEVQTVLLKGLPTGLGNWFLL